jgi:hypothetical protein
MLPFAILNAMNFKKIILATICISVPMFAFCQTFLPKAGISFSTLSISHVDWTTGFDNKDQLRIGTGFLVGFGFNFPVSKSFSIQPELMFVQKGTRTKAVWEGYGDDSGWSKTDIRQRLKINYFEMPVLFKYAISSTESKVPLYLLAGPSIAVGMGGKKKYLSVYENPPGFEFKTRREGQVRFSGEPWQLQPNDIRFDNVIDFGLQVGGGILLMKKILVDLRYSYSFTSLKNPSGEFNNKMYNRVVQFSVGMPISLKRR